ncbi:sulfite exporter TauE/SafE family protein [Clostridiales bacterium COT073_COT-073]|nr:sulfite exporter TauE/SafE family protein [Clostridiales bacterium COT073_COT-073]
MPKDYVLYAILIGVVIINGFFAVLFFRDYWKHKEEARMEPGNPFIISITSFIIYFLSTFGVSDYAISTALYRSTKWVDDKKLPGTLNTQCVLPVAVMALAYINSIEVDITTLILCILSQTLGSYILPRFVVKLPIRVIRKAIGFGLLGATIIILMGKFNLFPLGGELTGLTGVKLWVTVALFAVFGAMNTIGIGSYPVTMLTVYAMGLHPVIAFPIMMGACTFSVPVGSMEFVRLGQYARKITLISSIVGIFGVLLAVFVVRSMDISMLQWLVAVILVYSGSTMLYKEYTTKASAS